MENKEIEKEIEEIEEIYRGREIRRQQRKSGQEEIRIQEEGNITRQVRMANTSETSIYKNEVTKSQNKTENNVTEKTEKTSLKNKPKKFNKAKKFAVIGIIMAGALIGGIKEANNFIQEQADRSLHTVKEEIAESIGEKPKNIKILDKSSPTGSSSYVEYVTVNIGNQKYSYIQETIAGETLPAKVDEIMDPEIVKAIHIVGNAQKGNIIDAIKAKILSDQIENGKINLSMRSAVKDRTNEIDGNERE